MAQKVSTMFCLLICSYHAVECARHYQVTWRWGRTILPVELAYGGEDKPYPFPSFICLFAGSILGFIILVREAVCGASPERKDAPRGREAIRDSGEPLSHAERYLLTRDQGGGTVERNS